MSLAASTKKYYRIGEVCAQAELDPNTLRSWETEFPQLKPRKTSTGHRVFTEVDIDLVLRIKHLLQEEGYTFAGARKQLEGKTAPTGAAEKPLVQARFGAELAEVRIILKKVLNMLDQD